MEKDRNLRYQHASDIRTDLKRLKRDTESSRVTVAETSTARRVVRPFGKVWALSVAAVIVLIGMAVGAFIYLRRADGIGERNSVLLGDFVNSTGDSVFDDALRKALAISLEQSPYLNVFPEMKVRQALQLMGRSPDQRITNELAREIGERNGIKAVVTGSVASLGSRYVVALEAFDPGTGNSLGRDQVQANSKEAVLDALGKACATLRVKLGESLNSLSRFDKPLAQVTTSSLEALKAFTLGDVQHAILYEDLASIPFFQPAIELDPKFALAYARLSSAYENLGQFETAEQYSDKAFELRDRTSERERLYITGHYYYDTGQLHKALAAWEMYKQTYPRDPLAWDNLGVLHEDFGEFDQALVCAKEETRLIPDSAGGYIVSADAYRGLNRLEDAKSVTDAALKRGIQSWWLGYEKLLIALVQNDHSAEEQARMLLKASSEGEFNLQIIDQNLAFSQGKLHQGHALLAQVKNVAASLNLKEAAAETFAVAALFDAFINEPREAAGDAEAALAMARASRSTLKAAAALALAGFSTKAQPLAVLVEQRRPSDETVQSTFGPLVQAATLQRKNPMGAIHALLSASPYDVTNTPVLLLRGNAYLQAHQPDQAVREFRRMENLRSFYPQDPLLPLAELGLARAYTLLGDAWKSRTEYQNFLALWKDADPDIPILKEAKAEYAKLQ